jgi:hypothetical protein
MWLAENWRVVIGNYNDNQHNPSQIRQECRDAGMATKGPAMPRSRLRGQKTLRIVSPPIVPQSLKAG